MVELLQVVFGSNGFIPFGQSVRWQPALLWLEAAADGVLALSYVGLLLVLLRIIRKLRDFGMRSVLFALGALSLGAALTQMAGLLVIWHPVYWLEAGIKAATAIAALVAAVLLLRYLPKVSLLATLATSTQTNRELQTHIAGRQKAEEALRGAYADLERRVLQRTLELSDSNTRLQGEIAERQRVTEALKHSERLLLQFNDDLERSVDERTAELRATIEELESFSYSVSHDLRAPLRAINGYAEIVLEDHRTRLDGEGRELLAKIAANSVRMAQLIDGLLDFSRLGRRELATTVVDMTALACSTLAELRAQATIDGCSAAEVSIGELPPALGDAPMLHHVWVNLLANALKFSSQQAVPRVRIEGWREGSESIYAVRDNGIGFDMEFADRLFGVFQRLQPGDEFGGVGVGLAIVRRVVQRHGGRVWAESMPGQGANFYFAIKAATA
jgi:signal transduction histidine kinase